MGELHRFENPFTGYEILFKCIVDRHCPIKTKKVRGNDKPFMTRELSKAIKDRSRITNKYNKFKSRENFLEKQRIMRKCRFLQYKTKQAYFEKTLTSDNMTNKSYWKLMKPFLSEKGNHYGTKITLKEDGVMVSDEEHLAHIFNDQYINIVEKTTGVPPSSVQNNGLDVDNITDTIKNIIDKFKNHPSIKAIQENNQSLESFHIPPPQLSDIQGFYSGT